MTTPKTSKAEVLYTLIKEGSVSIMRFPHLSGFRTRISEITSKHGIPLSNKRSIGKNKFGNSFNYVEHILPEDYKDQAVELYKSINV